MTPQQSWEKNGLSADFSAWPISLVQVTGTRGGDQQPLQQHLVSSLPRKMHVLRGGGLLYRPPVTLAPVSLTRP